MNRIVLFLLAMTVSISISVAAGKPCPGKAQQQKAEKEKRKKERTATGVLQHFPSDVRSRAVWLGHEFRVGSTSVIATKMVTEKKLKSLAGKKVFVKGLWHKGEVWKPTEEELLSQNPVDAVPGKTVRGDGIRLQSIEVVKKQVSTPLE